MLKNKWLWAVVIVVVAGALYYTSPSWLPAPDVPATEETTTN